jgi:hypothetical protein
MGVPGAPIGSRISGAALGAVRKIAQRRPGTYGVGVEPASAMLDRAPAATLPTARGRHRSIAPEIHTMNARDAESVTGLVSR